MARGSCQQWEGKALYGERYNSWGAADRDWWELYTYVRRGSLPLFGAQYEDPALAVRELWEKLKFPATRKYAEDVDNALGKVVQFWRFMYRHGESGRIVLTPFVVSCGA